MTKLIPLTCGRFATVDSEDFDKLSQFSWTYVKGDYAKRFVSYEKINGKAKTVYEFMHRALPTVPDGMVVDHINRNGLDNRKLNLRICTVQENSLNSPNRKGSNSKYKGVYFINSKTQKPYWISKIRNDGKNFYVGYFKSEVEAAIAYNEASKKLHGQFAFLNQID